jgi:hypothetical protein
MILKKGEDCWWEAVFNLLVVVLVPHDIYIYLLASLIEKHISPLFFSSLL